MFLDANLFVYAYGSEERRGQQCKKFLQRILNGEQNACTSPLVLDEVLYYFINKKGLDFALRVHKVFFGMRNLAMLSINEKSAHLLPDLLREGLEPRDAFHVAVMRVNGISTICSYDKEFDKVKGIRRQEPK